MFIDLYNHWYGHVENDPFYKFYKHSFGHQGKKKFHSTKAHSHRFIPKFNMLEEKNYCQICGIIPKLIPN